ncbi:MAG: PhzF family phenazine biosynthesis protein [Rickettsiales bacterium]|jgi:PhzF family phenazine biosynthesis protein|nr:PhzF family phenazine biosynthesis protein [Rickettsiales bacterium]
MKKYEAFTAYAFTPLGGTDKAHGNPALVVFGDKSLTEKEKFLISRQARVELNDEMIELPIITFIEPVDVEKNNFNIQYYFCSGMEVSICGHGTLCATKVILEKYKKKNEKQSFTFNLNQSFEENRVFPQLKIESDGTHFTAEFDDVDFTPLAKDSKVYEIIQKNLPNIVDNTVYISSLKDYICVCSNAETLRKTIIPLTELRKIREIDETYRCVIAVSPSNIKGYDYETTVFSDGLPAPVYKDPACGSANKEMPKLLRITNTFPNRFKSGDTEHFRMFYPYRYAETGIMGGIQEVEYRYKENKIFVTCGVKFGKGSEITIDGDKIIF